MADILRIKRRIGGGPGAPSSLANAEIAYNEVDHILYYGEGTGGAGGTASVISPIAGQGLSSVALPLVNSGTVGVAGTSNFWSRGDHVHPSDTSRAPLAAPVFTGDAKAVTPAVGDEDTSIATTLFNARLSGGYSQLAAGDANVSLTATQMGYRVIRFVGALTADRTYTLPATTQKDWVVQNLTTGGFNITFSIGTGAAVVVLPMSMRTEIYTDGVNSVGSTQNLLSGNVLQVGDTGSNAFIINVGTLAANTTSISLAGSGLLQFDENTTFNVGLNLGSNFAASPTDLSKHIAFYGTTNGISQTSGRVNHVASATAVHWFIVNSLDVASISSTGINAAAIGASTPSTGAFTNLSVSGTVSGVGFAPYALVNSQVFTGTPSLPTGTIAVTQTPGKNDTTVATTAFVTAAAAAAGVTTFNTRSGAVTLLAADVTGLNLRLDQFQPPNVDVPWNSKKITGLLDPTNPQDAATKGYVDLAAQGLNTKQAARCATTTNLAALSGLLTVDGITVAGGDRVLVKDQTLSQNNGIYVAAAGAWARATDMDTWLEVPASFVFVVAGTANADNGYVCTSDPGGTLGTTAITWVQFSGAGQVIAGNGLVKTGNQIDAVGTASRISVAADSIDIDAAYAGQTSIVTLGTIATGTWNATTLVVGKGGSGATTLTGYLKGTGTTPFTASATIPNADIAGLGSMALQNSGSVTITGGTIDGITFDMGTF